jgi:hypothetical protein
MGLYKGGNPLSLPLSIFLFIFERGFNDPAYSILSMSDVSDIIIDHFYMILNVEDTILFLSGVICNRCFYEHPVFAL